MAKSELKDEKKKRKRQEEEAEHVSKKSKKSKKSKDAEVEDAPVVEEKREKKDKKDKKSKKAKKTESSAPAEDDATPSAATNGTANDSLQRDFIAFDDEPMLDAFTGAMNGTLSRSDSKKAKKDRKEKKSKKTKTEPESEEAAQAAEPDTVAGAVDGDVSTSKGEKMSKKDKKDKKDKKSKKSKGSEEVVNGAAEPMGVNDAVKDESAAISTSEEPDTKPKSKKDKKAKKDKKSNKASKTEDNSEAVDEPTAAADGTEEEAEQANGEQEAGKNDRFIVFIGNLPYSATNEQIEEHFAKLKPFEVRLRTYKDTGKPMGCAFIEFERYDHMQTALMKYHHSVFPDPKKKEGRKINVELSAGGGGNTAARVEKIKAKNEKLANERQRNHEKRAEIEGKQKERKEKKEAKSGAEGAEKDAAAEEPENTGIHPARLAMMNQPQQPEKKFKPNLGNRPKFLGAGPPKSRRY